MSTARLLVCVDGSRAALAAARLAVELAAEHDGGRVRAVTVRDEDRETTERLDARGEHETSASERRRQGLQAVLDRVTSIATDRGVGAETAVLEGDPLRTILRDARAWGPDLVVVGRTTRSGPGSPLVGSLAMHLAEFTEWPVVIVPEPGPPT